MAKQETKAQAQAQKQPGQVALQILQTIPSGASRHLTVIVPADGSKPITTYTVNRPPTGPATFESYALRATIGEWFIEAAAQVAGDPYVTTTYRRPEPGANVIKASFESGGEREISATVAGWVGRPELKAVSLPRPANYNGAHPEMRFTIHVGGSAYTGRAQWQRGETPILEVSDDTAALQEQAQQCRQCQEKAVMQSLKVEVVDPVTGKVTLIDAFTIDETRGPGQGTWVLNPHAPLGADKVTYRLDPDSVGNALGERLA